MRENKQFAQQHRGSPWQDELWKVSKGRTSAFGLGWAGRVEVRPCRQLSHVSAQVFTHGTIPLFTAVRQKSDRAAYLTLDVLIPALLLGEIFQGTANLLSSAPAEELSLHGPLPKYRPRRDIRRQDWHLLYSSGSPRHAVPLPRGLFNPSLEAKCGLKNCCTVILKLKFLPEFLVANSKGDFLGISKYSQFLKNI